MLAVFLRIGMLQYQGLFEPDGFYYYSVIMETLSNHLIVPAYSALSGFPVHNMRGEQIGMEYLTILPGLVLQYFGISYLTVMRFMPVLFGVLYTILAYFIAKHISNSRLLGLLAMFFVAVSSGNIARTAALVYRGDSFIALPLMVSLLLMLKALEGGKHRLVYVILSAVALSTGILVWTGSPVIIAVYMFALLMLIGYGFVAARKEMVETNVMLSLGLLLAYLLEHLYVYLWHVYPVSLYSIEFLPLYIPVLVAALAAMYLVGHMERFPMLGTARGRITVVAVVAIVAALIGFYPVTSYVWHTVEGTSSSLNATANPVGATTQELQAPSYQFLFASFNYQLFFAPLAVLLFLLLASRYDGKGKDHFSLMGMDLSINSGFLVAFAYFFVTSFMQALAIRYNAIVSIPIALLAAYFVYVLYMAVKDWSISNRTVMLPLVAVIDIALLYIIHEHLALCSRGEHTASCLRGHNQRDHHSADNSVQHLRGYDGEPEDAIRLCRGDCGDTGVQPLQHLHRFDNREPGGRDKSAVPGRDELDEGQHTGELDCRCGVAGRIGRRSVGQQDQPS